METSINEIVSDSWIPDYHFLEDSCVPVIMDLETTGLRKSAKIIQVAAKCGLKNFEVHILPKYHMSAKISEINGFTSSDGCLFYRGQKVKTVPSDVAARQFLDFLHGLNSQILLVGHNIIRFDIPLLIKWLNKHGLLKEFCSLVFGMTDTLPLLSQNNIRKQEKLAELYLVGPEWEKIRETAHNATTDCILLEGLLKHFQINDNILKNKSVSMNSFFQGRLMTKNQRKNIPLVTALKRIVSRVVLRRLARHGLTIDRLKTEYLENGSEKIREMLDGRIYGKVKITSKKQVIQNIINFLTKLIDSEKEISSKVET